MQQSAFSQQITRREALKRTVVFSTGLLSATAFTSAYAKEPDTKFSKKGMHLLALGDYGMGNESQRAVSKQMASFAKKLNAPLTSVLALGDNFYKQLTPDRFTTDFEEMYPKADFNCPFYACLGNHDYGPKYDSGQGRPKAQMQLDYCKSNPDSRWKLPAKWYSIELPNPEKPLVKIIILDGSFFEGAMTPQEKLEQKRWLATEMEKKTAAPWTWMISHYPIFTETAKRGDNRKLIDEWGGYLQKHPISLYLSGHDHNLQHLKVDGYNTSFVVSGAGGAALYDVKKSDRGYTEAILGFNHIHVTEDKMTVQFIDSEGRRLHAFERSVKGKTKLI